MNFDALEAVVIATAKEIREELNRLDVNRMELKISVEGRVGDGDLEIKYSLGTNYNDYVRGGQLGPVIQEALRRKGWNESHAPLCLPRAAE